MGVKTISWRSHKWPLHGILSLVGGCLIQITYSVEFTYSNLNTYVISYLRQTFPDLDYPDWIFVAISKTIVQGLLMTAGGEISRKIGIKVSIIIGSLIFSLGYFLTGISLTYFPNLACVAIFVGVFHALGFNLCYAQAIENVILWFPKNSGLMSSFCVAGYGLGAILWNPLQTAFVNPENVSAEFVGNSTNKYFIDGDVLSNVPNLFYLLGAIFIAMQIIGILLIKIPDEEDIEFIYGKAEEEEGDKKNSLDLHTMKQSCDSINTQETELQHENGVVANSEKGEMPTNPTSIFSLSPLQVLTVKEFYFMWGSFLAVNLFKGYFNNYQKAYGQLYIKDDRFFAYVGLLGSICNGTIRVFWGKMFDLTGFRNTVFAILAILSTLSYTFLLLTVIEPDSVGAKVFYAIWICGIFATFPGIYANLAPVVMAAFGPDHYSANFGLMFSQNIIYSGILFGTTKGLFGSIGYVGMFCFAGTFGIIGVIVVCMLPKDVKSEMYRERFENREKKSSKPI